jgi:hypothetical protein
VPDSDKDPKDLKKLTREELDAAAADAGVPAPEELPNKDAVIDAIDAPNPALAPIPPEDAGPGTYIVTAPTAVHGHQPGEKFSMQLPADQEALLIQSGALRKVADSDESDA